MKNLTKSFLTATALTVCMAGTSFAETKGTNAGPASDGTFGAVAQSTLAYQLYDYGVTNQDALSVLNAAKILAGVETKDEAREVEQKPTEGADTTEDGEGVDAPVDLAAMYAAAREMAGGDQAILDMITDAEAESSRGRIGGASRTLSRLPAGYSDFYSIPFYGGRQAEIAIVGDGDADLDLIVTDENGNVVCVDTSYSDQLYCSFNPIWDGYFHVGVENVGRVRNSYYILTN